METEPDPQAEARAWFERLGQPRVSAADVRAFGLWRDQVENDAAYSALELGLDRTPRFVARPMTETFRIVDIWTGATPLVDDRAQLDLSEGDAKRVAARLNRKSGPADAT